jgi:hypothetical protein
MKRPTPADHRRFCDVDGWERTADKPGRRVKKHEVWTKRLPDGTLLRTAISKGNQEYGRALFANILNRQLRTTERGFWNAVDDGVPFKRLEDVLSPHSQRERIPAWLVVRLTRDLGYTAADLRDMTRDEAQRRYERGQRSDDPPDG